MNNSVSIVTEGNYLVIECVRMDYKLRMLEANRIPGLLRLEIHEENDSRKLYYDIASKESFDSVVSSRTLRLDDIRNLVFSLNRTLKSIEDYLLDENDLILDRKYIYISGDKLEPVFCCCPGYSSNFCSGLSSLLQELLGMVDSGDRSAVVLAYALYQATLKSGYGIADLVRVVNNNNIEPEPEKKPPEEKNVQYKDENVEIVAIAVTDEERTAAEEDLDELYVSLNADPKKYHFGNHNRRNSGEKKQKRKKGLGFLR